MFSDEKWSQPQEASATSFTTDARHVAVQQADRDPILHALETPVTNATGDIDLEQLRHRLQLSPADRIRENDRFSRFLETVRKAGGQPGRNP